MTKKIIIANRDRNLQVLNYGESFQAGKGKYRVIVKCQAGFMVSGMTEAESPIKAFRQYKPKAIQSITYIKDIDGAECDFTVYARSGKKVWASEEFLAEVEVGDINQDLHNTALYDQHQYNAVKAKSWASKAYVMNQEA